jgi:hypothetical protein
VHQDAGSRKAPRSHAKGIGVTPPGSSNHIHRGNGNGSLWRQASAAAGQRAGQGRVRNAGERGLSAGSGTRVPRAKLIVDLMSRRHRNHAIR